LSQATGNDQDITVVPDTEFLAFIRKWLRQKLVSDSGENKFEALVDRFASVLVSEALNLTRGNRSQAARLLGLSRPTLQAKIDKYRLKVETLVKADDQLSQ